MFSDFFQDGARPAWSVRSVVIHRYVS